MHDILTDNQCNKPQQYHSDVIKKLLATFSNIQMFLGMALLGVLKLHLIVRLGKLLFVYLYKGNLTLIPEMRMNLWATQTVPLPTAVSRHSCSLLCLLAPPGECRPYLVIAYNLVITCLIIHKCKQHLIISLSSYNIFDSSLSGWSLPNCPLKPTVWWIVNITVKEPTYINEII